MTFRRLSFSFNSALSSDYIHIGFYKAKLIERNMKIYDISYVLFTTTKSY